MLTTTLVAIQTFFCAALPLDTIGFNILAAPESDAPETTLYFGLQHFASFTPAASIYHKITQQSAIEEAYRIKTVVIDPGHGGHDPGCLGSAHQEKHLTLALSKRIAALIAAQFPDVRVIMTRETDVFIPLHERARIANQNNADLFISIHCNYMPGSRVTAGSETYVMGLHTAQQNLEVAKRENAAILLEENYQQNYDFDPNSPEAHIMLSMFQNAYLEQSILLAERVEERINTHAGRKSRGVKQAGFYVLKATTMPSILIETGFLSNREEEIFLATVEGQEAIAGAIAVAFAEYKQLVERGQFAPITSTIGAPYAEPPKPANPPQVVRVAEQTVANGNASAAPKLPAPEKDRRINESPRAPDNVNGLIQFCVQLAASAKPVDTGQSKWKNSPYLIEVVQEDSFYKYQARGFSDFEAALNARSYFKMQGFPDAFLVAYKNGKKISIEEAKQELGVRY